MTELAHHERPIIVFDAMCILCSANAAFVLKHDRAGRFLLASMQGDVGASLYQRFGIDPTNPETLIVVLGDRVLRDSDAVLFIWTGLARPWNSLALFRIVPRWIRDPVYQWIARYRYKLFGKRQSCWIPAPEQALRIL